MLVLFAGTAVAATARQDAFSRLDLRAGPSWNLGSDALSPEWERGLGVELGVDTPFYVGSLTAGIRLLAHPAALDVPDFRALAVWAGWGRSLSVSRFRIGTDARLGNLRMSFDDPDAEPGIRNESEFTGAVTLWTDAAVGARSRLRLAWSAERTYTDPLLDLGYLSVSYVHSIRTPSWLEDFLK